MGPITRGYLLDMNIFLFFNVRMRERPLDSGEVLIILANIMVSKRVCESFRLYNETWASLSGVN